MSLPFLDRPHIQYGAKNEARQELEYAGARVLPCDIDTAMQFAADWLVHSKPYPIACRLPLFVAALATLLATYDRANP